MTTMQAVADAAGVSVSTVSHVINKTRKIHPDTLKAVEAAIIKVGYTPNRLARALAGGSTSTVGVAISALSNRYFAATAYAIEAECARNGLMMMLVDTHESADYEFNVVQALRERRVDGIIIAPTADPNHRTLNYLRAQGVPTVLVDRAAPGGFDQVLVESQVATEVLTNHVIGLGHMRIALISGVPGLSTTEDRIAGYKQALTKAKLPIDDALIVTGMSQFEPARSIAKQLAKSKQPPTAIITGNNIMTIGALTGLREVGIRVPEDMSLAGFDDIEWADVLSPRLTVMAQPVEELGSRAVRLLKRRIETPDARRQSIRLDPTLCVRDSVRKLTTR